MQLPNRVNFRQVKKKFGNINCTLKFKVKDTENTQESNKLNLYQIYINIGGKNMKKSILTSAAAMASLALLAGAIYANPTEGRTIVKQKLENSGVLKEGIAIRLGTLPLEEASTKEVTGKIEKLTEHFMVVADKNQTLYTVPLAAFSNLEEFKALNLQIGDEVALKSMQLFVKPAVEVFETTEAVEAVKAADAEMDEAAFDAGKTKGLFKVIKRPTENAADQSAVLLEKAEHKEGRKVIRSIPAVPAAAADKDTAFLIRNEKGSMEPEVTHAIAIDIEEDSELFIAEEIHSNGRTVKLPKFTATMNE